MNVPFSLILLTILLFSCDYKQDYVPKPRVYPKINYPERTYGIFENENCPFQMEVPQYLSFIKDSLRHENPRLSDCWFELYSHDLNVYFYMSYLSFDSRNGFDVLIKDAFEMADKHNVKANYRDELSIRFKDKNLYGLLFEIDGPVAAPLQFYLTDSTQHFLRGSLYFNAKVNRDSIAPVYDFIKEDFNHMVKTFSWK